MLVIGGGATGSGCALDAVSRGLRTALVEREDFSSGTSSRYEGLHGTIFSYIGLHQASSRYTGLHVTLSVYTSLHKTIFR